jgi:hypothetical protein
LSRLAEVPMMDTRATQIERRIEIPVIVINVFPSRPPNVNSSVV